MTPGFLAAVPAPDDDAIRRRLNDILSRAEFGRGTNLLRWVNDLVGGFFAWLGTLVEASPLLYWGLLTGCLLVLGLILFHIGWTVRRVFFLPRDGRGRAETAEQRRRVSQAHRDEARRRAERGEYTEAIRFLFLSLVYRLDEEGRVLFRRSATNREYLDLFRDRPRVRDGLRVFVDALDEHWYGQRPAGAGQYERCQGLYDELLRSG